MITRRFLLAAAGLSAAAATLPKAMAAAAPVAAPEAAPLAPMWVVGTPEEYDWLSIRAPTMEEAIREWEQYTGFVPDCADWRNANYDCHCGKCGSGAAAHRAEALDHIEKPKPADWVRAGFGHTCCRCHDGTGYEECYPIGDDAICDDCLTDDERKALWPALYGDAD